MLPLEEFGHFENFLETTQESSGGSAVRNTHCSSRDPELSSSTHVGWLANAGTPLYRQF